MYCGLCERRMQSHWVNGAPYYRCRFPAEYALANRVEHPINVNLREDAVIGHVDKWPVREFAPHRLNQTIRDLADAQTSPTPEPDFEDAKLKIAECDRKLVQYRAALDSGASPVTVAGWIAETEAELARYELSMRHVPAKGRMSEAEITDIVARLADIARVLHDADPDDKAEIFRQLGLRMTYHPGKRIVRATIDPTPHWQIDGVRGPSRTLRT